MAKTVQKYPLIPLFSIAVTLLLFPEGTAASSNGFSLELIHRDSIDSPFYPQNLTDNQRLQRLVKVSESRIQWLQKRSDISESSIWPTVSNDMWAYMVRVGIGSRPVFVYLLLDTGSDLLWTQCWPCNPCFHQLPPLFIPHESSSYQPLPTSHPLCARKTGGTCVFQRRYQDSSYTKGVLATDHFTFASRSHGSESVPNLVFGCARESSDDMFADNPRIGGIFGLDDSAHSLVIQMAAQTQLRFSYCLTPASDHAVSHLRFGSDVVIGPNLQRTRLLRSNNQMYHLEMLDISINNRRLNLPPGTFMLRPNGEGGCSIDTGAPMTHIITPAYNAVKNELTRYFARYNLRRFDRSEFGFDVCYIKPPNFRAFPSMILHFRGADLRLEFLNVFYIFTENSAFCLTMRGNNDFTVIGTTQQQNIRFVYDLRAHELLFAPESCANS